MSQVWLLFKGPTLFWQWSGNVSRPRNWSRHDCPKKKSFEKLKKAGNNLFSYKNCYRDEKDSNFENLKQRPRLLKHFNFFYIRYSS